MVLKPILFKEELRSKQYNHLNSLHDFYLKIWRQTCQELNISEASLHDDFHRFKEKMGIFLDNRPIAFHGYGHFDLNIQSDQNHTFFKKLKKPVAEKLYEQGLRKVVSLEYMAVHPEFRKIANQHVGDILGGFSTQLHRHGQHDAVIGIARNNRSVNKIGLRYGGHAMFENLPLNNVEVDVIVFEPQKICDHPDPHIQATINNLLAQLDLNTQPYGVAA